MKSNVILLVVLMFCAVVNASIANFDDLTLSPNSYWNGSNGTGDFTSGSAVFNNNYNSTYHSWDGWAYSNKPQQDPVEKGMAGQYTAITGSAQSGSNYGIAYIGWTELPSVILNSAGVVEGIYVTNNNYAYYSMLEGDSFAKKFGGTTGSDPDWFKLTVTGKNASGAPIGTIDFYLADYRFADNANDYIVDSWEYVGLSLLGAVKSLEFTLDSSDHFISGGIDYGMNTPAYFAMDTVIPEPATAILFSLGGLLLRRRKR